MPGWLEQTSGLLLLALMLLDVFLVVLYARLGTGILVGQLASALAYTREAIDPAGTNPERMTNGPRPTTELAREPFPEQPQGASDDPGPLR